MMVHTHGATDRPAKASDANANRANGMRVPSLDVSFGGHSAAGVKSRNDDAFAAALPDGHHARQMKGAVACIADGISVSTRSHLASQLAVTQFIEDYFATPDVWSVETCAEKVLRALNDWLSAQSRHNQTSAMVTTFSTAIVKSKSLHVFHIGDSRIYRLRDGKLVQMTRDHAMRLAKGDAVLTAALGADTRLSVDYSSHSAQSGDVILLTTDGITGILSEQTLQTMLNTCLSEPMALESIAQHICNLAIDKGSQDNVTCGLMRVEDVPLENIDEAERRLKSQIIPPVMQPGHKIDDYKIHSIIHSGTRSHIYKVCCQHTGKPYILKAPSENFRDDLVYLEGFVRERWVGRRLNHPGLMKIHAGRENSEFLYLLCEAVQGQTLRAWMVDNPKPSLSQVREIIGNIILPLRALHRMGMVHRDIKPENIMLTHSGDIKIIDYGTVQVAGMSDIHSAIKQAHALGSVEYSAPEYVLGERATAQSDLFSLGVIAYEMLAGIRPYRDKSSNRPRRLESWQYKALQDRRPDIPYWVAYAIEVACAKTPERRYPAMSEFWGDLCKPSAKADHKAHKSALIERNPLAFWRGLSLFLMALCLTLFAALAHH